MSQGGPQPVSREDLEETGTGTGSLAQRRDQQSPPSRQDLSPKGNLNLMKTTPGWDHDALSSTSHLHFFAFLDKQRQSSPNSSRRAIFAQIQAMNLDTKHDQI